jgi:hypothetical protein
MHIVIYIPIVTGLWLCGAVYGYRYCRQDEGQPPIFGMLVAVAGFVSLIVSITLAVTTQL